MSEVERDREDRGRRSFPAWLVRADSKRERFARLTALSVGFGLLALGVLGVLLDVSGPQGFDTGPVTAAAAQPGVVPTTWWAHAAHLLLGVVGVVLSLLSRAEAARRYVLFSGVVLLVWALMRFIFEEPVVSPLSGWVNAGWLHLGVAVVVTAIGFWLRSIRERRVLADPEEHP